MSPEYLKSLSKFVSLILRHKPEVIGLKLDKNGWADVDQLIKGSVAKGKEMDLLVLEMLVASDEKQRYTFNDDKTAIRANQGHSVKVDLELEPAKPPRVLFYGTVEDNIQNIMLKGISPQSRNHVHLTETEETAFDVGKRPSGAIIFKVYSGAMFRDGFHFHPSANNIWLIDNIPNKYLDLV